MCVVVSVRENENENQNQNEQEERVRAARFLIHSHKSFILHLCTINDLQTTQPRTTNCHDVMMIAMEKSL
jgi:hypothetical protein